jgi:hypothetical protein
LNASHDKVASSACAHLAAASSAREVNTAIGLGSHLGIPT